MRNREPDLDRITTLLGQCLGRIDEQAYRVQRLDDDGPDCAESLLCENEDSTLQELMDSLLESSVSADQADLNPVVKQAVRSFLGETGIPVVVREKLADDLPPIGCGPGQLAFAVQRALVIALGRMDTSREIDVTTRADNGSVVFEVESRGTGRDRHLQERTLTLCEFVAGFNGNCRIDSDQRGSLLIVIELPQALPMDEY